MIIELKHISDKGRRRLGMFDLDSMKIVSLLEFKDDQPFIHWTDPRFDENVPDIKCSLNELNKIFAEVLPLLLKYNKEKKNNEDT